MSVLFSKAATTKDELHSKKIIKLFLKKKNTLGLP